MTAVFTTLSIALAVAWVPLALRFLRGWRARKNPVSLAICAALCLFSYTDLMFALVTVNATTWRFFTVATYGFNLVVVVNFYVAFRWSATRFPDARNRGPEYIVPPMN